MGTSHHPAVHCKKMKIKKEEVNGIKGYFMPSFPRMPKTKKNGLNVVEVKINISRMQPGEVW